MDKIDQLIADFAAFRTEQNKALGHIKGRLTKLENSTAEVPMASGGSLVAETVKAVMADEKERNAFLGELDLETIHAAERAAAHEVDQRLWQESKVKYAGRKVRQFGPTLLVGAAAGIGGMVAVNRYKASGAEDVEVTAEPGDLKVAM